MDNKFVLSQSFNEIVFEKRNKKYGAYDIRRKYSRYALVAGACAILFFTCGSLTWAYVASPEALPKVLVTEVDISEMKDYGDKDLPKEEENIPKEQEIQSPPDKGAPSPDITAEIEVVEETITPPPAFLESGKDTMGVVGGTGPVKQILTGGDCINCPKKDSIVPIRIVDYALYPPTCEALDPHLTANIRYPDICREMGIEGTVYVEFIVDTKGNYRDVKVLKGPHPALNKEALRVMSTMPKWTPAKDDKGELVEFIMRKPIKFQLAK